VGTLVRPADGTPARVRTWATDTEVCEHVREVRVQQMRPGGRLYASVENHCADLYGVLRKRMAVSHRPGHITVGQLAADLYDDVDPRDLVEAQRKRRSIRRWLNWLAAAGLITWQPDRIDGDGKFVGLTYRLLPVPSAGASPRSSAG
jgi:hypothetical protein